MKKIILVALLIFSTNTHATTSGTQLQLTEAGVARLKLYAEKVALAEQYAGSVLGSGYSPTGTSYCFAIKNGTGGTDLGCTAVSPVSPDANPGSSSIVDDSGRTSNTVGNTCGDSSCTHWRPHGNSDAVCDGTPVLSGSGSCADGAVPTSCKTTTINLQPGPWYKPQRCNCDGACTINSGGGCPFTTASPCVPNPTLTTNIFEYTRSCVCANGNSTSESTAYANDPPPDAPAGAAYQPSTIPSGWMTSTSDSLAKIQSAITALQSRPGTSDGGLDFQNTNYYNYSFARDLLLESATILSTGITLSGGEYTYAPGYSPACSTCGLPSPSSGTTGNVWIQNPQLHVFVDNQPSFTSSVTVNISSVMTLGSVSISTYDDLVASTGNFVSTLTISGVYSDWLVTRATIPIQGLVNSFHLPTITADTLPHSLTINTTYFGTHTVDLDDWGFATFLLLMRFAVIGGSFITAYFIIYG